MDKDGVTGDSYNKEFKFYYYGDACFFKDDIYLIDDLKSEICDKMFFNRGKFIIITIITGLLAISAGCGYHLRADGRPMGIVIDSIAIPLITSTSTVKGFEADFTSMIREEFISHAAIPVVASEEADAILTGRIYEIRTQPFTYDIFKQEIAGRTITHETTSSRRLKIRLDVRLTEKKSGREIWRDNGMEEDAQFDIGTDPLINRYNEQNALKKIAERLAKKIYLKTMERF